VDDAPEPLKPPWIKKRRNERDDDASEHVAHTWTGGGIDDRSDRRYRYYDPDELIDSPEKQAHIAYLEGRPDWREQWEAAQSPDAQQRARFINCIYHELDSLAKIPDKLRHINGVAPDVYDELWAHLTLKALHELRETSERVARQIIIEMINKNIITPHAAAKSSGYSRTSVYNWLKEAGSKESEPPPQ